MSITQRVRRLGRTVTLAGLASAAGLGLFAGAAAPASAASFGVWIRDHSSAYYNDKADTLLVCDRGGASSLGLLGGTGGGGVTAWIGVQQEDGTWRRFAPVKAFQKCVQERRDVIREASRVRITLCEDAGMYGYRNCKSAMRTGR